MEAKHLAYFILIILFVCTNLKTMEPKDKQEKIVLLQKQLKECNQSKDQLKDQYKKLKKEHEKTKSKHNHESYQKEAWKEGYSTLFHKNYALKEDLRKCMQSSQENQSESDSLKE